jgi:polar amino acid transport system ATP-binding protein
MASKDSLLKSKNPNKFVWVRDVHKTYGDIEVLKGINLQVKKGDVLILIGASGSGKSTLLRCIHLLETIDTGEIYVDSELMGHQQGVDGRPKKNSSREITRKRSNIGMVFQHFNLFSHLTALENVKLALTTVKRMSKTGAEELAFEKLKQMGLEDKAHSYPAHLSGGQQQRVGIARALAVDPKLMLFDEPTSALDPELVGEILEIIKGMAKEGMTMILVTHELGFARKVADKIAFLHEGRIIEKNSPAEMLDNPQHEVAKSFLRRIIG